MKQYKPKAAIPCPGFANMGEVELIAAVCPSCGASLKIPDNLDKAHCMYCGTVIFIHERSSQHKPECKICEGYGRVDRCKACDGTGKCTWSARLPGLLVNGIPVTHRTAQCYEGVCSLCGGAGKGLLLHCDACNGSGKCPRCFGTGKCVSCRGVGFFPNQNGEEKCHACNGTGTVDGRVT